MNLVRTYFCFGLECSFIYISFILLSTNKVLHCLQYRRNKLCEVSAIILTSEVTKG